MLIIKSKQSIFLSLTKAMECKSFEKCPKKGIVWEFQSLTNFEAFEVSEKLTHLDDEENRTELRKAFLDLAISKVVKVHNFDFQADYFQLDTYIPLMIGLFQSSVVSEDDSFYCA